MTTPWHTLLEGLGASFSNGQLQHFGEPQAELQAAADDNVICDLSHLGLLQLEGDDRVSFLQGQVTNDVRLLNGNNSHYSGYCTPKGRLLALFLTFSHHDHLHLQFNRQLLEPVMKRLKMYVLRSKVSISDVSDSIVRMGLAGPQAGESLQSLFALVPQEEYGLTSLEDATLIWLPGRTPRYEILTSADHAERIWTALSQHARPAGAACWEWLEIQAGIPDITPATQEAFVPQMLNLDALGAINFKKGCYTGQEIVARTHYLGKVKRRTLPLHAPAGQTASVGSPLYTSGSEEAAGMVVRVAPSPLGGIDLLGELRLEAIASADIHLDKSAGALQRLALPYPLD
jgi:tRNA-modifying protein YgfZ